jgi:lipid-A-disaccharide synthase
MKYYFIAGEASGDLHGANCMKEILKIDTSAEFRFTGGDLMEEVAGRKADIHIRDMAFMGFVDVLKNAGRIRRNFRIAKRSILDFKPNVLMLVDYPGFNLRMAKWATRSGIRTDYYISPTVWAWKEDRVQVVRKYTHKMFVILPFEKKFYERHGHHVQFVGHPLVDEVESRRSRFRSRAQFLQDNNLPDKPVIAMLPGSRQQEIERMLGIMTSVVPHFSGYTFVVAGSASLPVSYYEGLKEKGIYVLVDQTYELMNFSAAGVIKSGTSTLESALFRLPQVVCYRGGALSFAIGKRLVNVKYISLVNLIMDRPVVKELIQNDLTAENIREELQRLLHDSLYRARIIADYDELVRLLGGSGASKRVAEEVVKDASELKA